MNFLTPRIHATIDVNAAPDEVQRHLVAHVNPRRLWALPSKEMPLRGKVTGRTFCVSRARFGHNSFHPFVDGEITSTGSRSTRITLTYRMAHGVGVFVLLWFAALAAFLLPTGHLLLEEGIVLPIVTVLVMGVFGVGLVTWGIRVAFPAEVRKTGDVIQMVLDGLETGA